MTTRNRGKLDSARSTRFFSNESTISVDCLSCAANGEGGGEWPGERVLGSFAAWLDWPYSMPYFVPTISRTPWATHRFRSHCTRSIPSRVWRPTNPARARNWISWRRGCCKKTVLLPICGTTVCLNISSTSSLELLLNWRNNAFVANMDADAGMVTRRGLVNARMRMLWDVRHHVTKIIQMRNQDNSDFSVTYTKNLLRTCSFWLVSSYNKCL